MPASQPQRDEVVAKLVSLGTSRATATEIVDIAHHAVEEALKTVLRVCEVLPEGNEIAAVSLALKWLQAAAKAELDDLVAEAITRERKKRRHPDGDE